MKTIKMKTMTNFKLLFFVAALLVAFTSCNKDKNGDDPGHGTMSAKIDGTSINFNNITAAKAIGGIAINGDNDNKDKSMSFVLPDDISEGTYDLGNNDSEILIMYQEGSGDDGNGYFSTSGELKITKHNNSSNKIVGTFHFEGTNFNATVNVTDGKFDVKYDEAK